MAEPRVFERAWARRPDWPRACAALLMALGTSVLAGWALGVEPLTRVSAGMTTMKPNAALGFLLAGLALRPIRDGRTGGRRAIGLSWAVAAIGGLTLLEYLAGVDLGIDQVLAREPPGQVGSLSPGRMHPSTAFNFLILGISLALTAADREPRASQGLALVAALVAGSTLVGYLYGVRVFVGLAIYQQMALHTTMGMILLASGTLLARPGRGWMGPITVDGPGGMMARGLIPVAILTPVLISGLIVLARREELLDERFATAVQVTLVVAIFVACIGRSARLLDRVDRERLRAEAGRAEGERRSRFLAESMPQIVWISRPDGAIEYFNRRWYDYTGRDPRGGLEWLSALHPDDLARCLDLWGDAVGSGRGFEGEYRFRRRDGAFRWHLSRAEPMLDEGGRIVQWVGTCTDIDDHKRAGEQRFRSLVEATTSIVWSTPASGLFESEQPAWGAFTGQSFGQLMGRGWLDAVHPEDRQATDRAWREATSSRSPYEVKHRLRRHDGEYRHMQVRAVPLLDQDGSVREWVGVHSDVDGQERAHQAMRQAKEAAEAATRAKGEFLANMSHEIRTPMNGVLGMTELALDTDLSPLQREYIGLVKSSADALLTVIDDILDFSKIEAGKLELDPVPFSPRDLAAEAVRTLALKSREKGLALDCRVAPEVPEVVVGDPGRLRQVLLNLVGNAIKFTERGEVVVAVEALADEFRFSVADTGIGIPEEKREAIFAAFEQADGSTTRKYGGTGLGLTISARLVELMQGRIWVEENPGGGSIFRFTARLGRDLGLQPARGEARPVGLDGLRVLVVDDDRANRADLDEILSQWGCRPLAVASGPDALDALDRAAGRGRPFALALIDRSMPRMDGCELARRIRADPRHRPMRMLMLASGGPDDPCRSRDLGIGGWLPKPVRQSELRDAMLALLRPEPAPPPPASTSTAPAPAPAPAPTAGGSRRLRVLLAEDHPINQKVATRMLEGLGHEVTVVGDGRLALRALESGAFDLLLMDVQMPGMGGFEALEQIRAAERSRGGRLPVIALTAHAMVGDRDRCLEAGFDDYLTKPVTSAALARATARVAVDPGGGPAPSREAPGPGRPFDRETTLRALEGDEGLLAEVLELFLDQGPRFLAEARLAIGRGDARALARLGHTLAGSAGHLAAEGLVDSARRLGAAGEADDLEGAKGALRDFAGEFDRFRMAAAGALRSGQEALEP